VKKAEDKKPNAAAAKKAALNDKPSVSQEPQDL
jgi:hypothetical protein